MRGQIYSYRRVVDQATGKARTVKSREDLGKGARWGYVIASHNADDAGHLTRTSSGKAGFARKRDAQAALSVALAERGTSERKAPVEPSRVRLSEYIADEWLPAVSHTKKPTTLENYRQLHRAYIAPHIGAVPLREIDSGHLVRLYARLEAGGGRGGRPLSPMTVHHVSVLLSTVLGYAVEAGHLRVNAALSIPKTARRKQPKRSPDKLRYWTPPQAAAFITATADERLGVLWSVALQTGLRRGELAGLQWRDLDLDPAAGHAVLAVARQRTKIGREVVEQTPKTDSSARTIELGPALVRALRAHRAQQAAEQLAWGPAWEGDGRGWVFTYEKGTTLDPTWITGRTKVLAHRAGLPWVGVHGLRHTCAVMLLAAGVPLKVVSERLGHTSVAFTADLYQHVIPGMQHAASMTIERALGIGMTE